jgi:putative ATPase
MGKNPFFWYSIFMHYIPLAEKMRPKTLDEVVGQPQLTGENGILRASIDKRAPFSFLLWGPPGSGKTTLARIYAKGFDARFISLSGVTSNTQDLKQLVKELTDTPLFRKPTILFIDEIHRWNRAQQDYLLPHLEKGLFILIGATTENPSFSLNNALLSRMRVLTVSSLASEDLQVLLQRYETQNTPLPLSEKGKASLLSFCGGDGRYLYHLLEALSHYDSQEELTEETLASLLQKRACLFDRAQDQHYDLISALHKSVRGSDPDASLYWFCRMLAGGEDPLFIGRRLVRMATEDIGLADPNALGQATHACEAYQRLGSPEGELCLAQAVVYLALAPKSNSIYLAYKAAKQTAEQTGYLPPPKTILNAPTQLMKELNYGKGYQYDHDTPYRFSGQNYFPENLERQEFYTPVEIGFEREMKKRKDYFSSLRERLSKHL